MSAREGDDFYWPGKHDIKRTSIASVTAVGFAEKIEQLKRGLKNVNVNLSLNKEIEQRFDFIYKSNLKI